MATPKLCRICGSRLREHRNDELPDDRDQLAQRFEGDMLRLYDRWRLEIGYVAPRFKQLVGIHGGVGAARRLLTFSGESGGFARLLAEERLELTVEYLVLRIRYEPLFALSERRRAWSRLLDNGMLRSELPLEPS